MTAPTSLLPSTDSWIDGGYAYHVAVCRDSDSVRLDVSRVLANGRMSPIVGRRAFMGHEEPVLSAIFAGGAVARSLLVDQIIRGGPIWLGDILQTCSCEADLG